MAEETKDLGQGQGQPGATPGGTPGGTPQYGEWYTKIPEALRGQIPAETLQEINKGWMQNSDYTKKTQELAPLRTLSDKYKGRDLSKELERLEQWDGWRKTHWPTIEQQLKAANEAKGQNGKVQPGGDGARSPKLMKATPDDFFDQERLNGVLAGLEEQFAGSATQAFKHWYQNEELGRLDKVAASYLGVVTGLIKLLWPKDSSLPAVDDLLKQAIASGDYDFGKYVGEVTGKRKEIEDSGFERGLAEGLKRAAAQNPPSPAPPGSGMPSWSPPPGGAKGEDALFQEVMGEVTRRHGALPA